MYLRILKKDIKRKKTMNIILLIFTILASVFVSSGVSNVITVMNGTDYFMDKAGIGDYIVFTQTGDGGVEDILKKSANVSDYKKEKCYWATKDDLTLSGKKTEMKSNTLIIQRLEDTGIRYFHTDNTEVVHVEKGEVYVTAGFLKNNNIHKGDEIQISLHGVNNSLKIAGEIKDALLGSDMMGNTRLIISDEDFELYEKEESLNQFSGSIFYADTEHVKKLSTEVSGAENILFEASRDKIKLSYVMEMIVAMVVLVLSVCLVLVSFVLLKFVITFSISEEYREIGVMKAVGIRDFKIRSLYIIKYMAIAVTGGIIGLAAGIPFGNYLISAVSEKMVLGNDSGLSVNVLGSAIVVFIMIGFSYMCTGKVKKATPVDAIRSGQTGERYTKKSVYSIKKSHLGNAFYMAVNDVLSAPKRFVTIIFSFFLCSLFVFGLVEVADTMKSDRLITTFGKKSDVYISDAKLVKMDFMSYEGNISLPERYRQIENDLESLGMPGKVSMEVWYMYPVTVDGETTSVVLQQNKETSADEYEYIKGTAPGNAKEIAITPQISKKLNVHIGDKITINYGEEKVESMVVGYFQTMNQLGEVMRIHEDAPARMENASAMMAFQIDFDEKPDAKELSERIEKIKDYYDVEGVFDSAGYCDDCMGVADAMDAVAKLLLVITCIVVVLVTVLMERSFIQEEVNQIALLKAIGFKNRYIIKWHVIRFMIITIVSEIMAAALTYPVTKLWCDPIWNMMGATHVEYYFKPLSLIVIYPGIILGINFIAVLLTALYTNRITSRDMMNIE